MPRFASIFEDLLEEQLSDEFTDKEMELFTASEFMPDPNQYKTYRDYILTILDYYSAKVALKRSRTMNRLTWALVVVATVQTVFLIVQVITTIR